jgi:hypothetical protein
LIFSSRLDIKDPASYPSVQAIQTTQVLNLVDDRKQYVFQDIKAKISIVDLLFLAPCAEDSLTPISLGTEAREGGRWLLLPFRTEGGAVGQTQAVRRPAFVCPPLLLLEARNV